MKYSRKKIQTGLSLALFMFIATNVFADKKIEMSMDDYVGKIVFSNQSVNLDEIKSADLSKDFTLMEDIHAFVLMNSTLKDAYNSIGDSYNFRNASYNYNYALKVYVDEVLTETWLFEMSPTDYQSRTSYGFALTDDDPKVKRFNSSMINFWFEAVKGLSNGVHKVNVKMVAISKDVVGDEAPVLSSGTFDLHVEKEKMEAFKKAHTTGLPQATLSNKRLENLILDESTEILDNAIPQKVIITDRNADWTYDFDMNGNIVYRNIVATIAFKTINGNCLVQTASFGQKHQGYGDFGPLQFEKNVQGYYEYSILCDKIQK